MIAVAGLERRQRQPLVRLDHRPGDRAHRPRHRAGRRPAPGGYWRVQGTSFAAPLVAATAALVRSRYPQMPAGEVVNRLLATARDLGPTGRDDRFGYGVVDPVAALTAQVPPVIANPLDDQTSPGRGRLRPGARARPTTSRWRAPAATRSVSPRHGSRPGGRPGRRAQADDSTPERLWTGAGALRRPGHRCGADGAPVPPAAPAERPGRPDLARGWGRTVPMSTPGARTLDSTRHPSWRRPPPRPGPLAGSAAHPGGDGGVPGAGAVRPARAAGARSVGAAAPAGHGGHRRAARLRPRPPGLGAR